MNRGVGCRWQSKDKEDLQAHCRAIEKGRIYDWKDFCRVRAPTWYQAQTETVLRACTTAGLNVELYKDYTKADWDKERVWWHVENALKSGTIGHVSVSYGSRRDIKSASFTPPHTASNSRHDSFRDCRVQPSRTSKRKAGEIEDSDECIKPPAKKIKIEDKSTESDTTDHRPPDSHGGYQLSEEEFRKSLKDFHVHTSSLSLSPSRLADRTMLHATEWFRSRVMAEVVAKVNTRWNARTKTKQHRCQLSDRRTEHPYVDPETQTRCGKFTAINYINVNQPAVADMLSSPSLGKWPVDTETENKNLPEEKMLKSNIVEIAGLRFLVDLCESNRWVVHDETEAMVSPRIWML